MLNSWALRLPSLLVSALLKAAAATSKPAPPKPAPAPAPPAPDENDDDDDSKLEAPYPPPTPPAKLASPPKPFKTKKHIFMSNYSEKRNIIDIPAPPTDDELSKLLDSNDEAPPEKPDASPPATKSAPARPPPTPNDADDDSALNEALAEPAGGDYIYKKTIESYSNNYVYVRYLQQHRQHELVEQVC